MERNDREQKAGHQYGAEQPPPLPSATPVPPRRRTTRQPLRAPASPGGALTALRLALVLIALPLGVAAELVLGSIRPSPEGIGRMLQMLLAGPMLLVALFGAMISTPLLLHWLLTRIDTTLDNWIFWALLATVALNGHVLYAHAGLWPQLRG